MSVFEVPALKKMKEYFQVVASYNDTTKHKPDPEPLYFALRGLGVVAKEAVYVGDAEVDEKAALAAGVPFIAFGNPALTAAQAHATSFADLPPLISMIARNR
jgi:phosphoglycolate phosphatase-like HAD superfamily hydrolase